jgi:hypothetical protein
MLTWNQLHETLARASRRHEKLYSLFSQFGQGVVEEVVAPNFHIKGILAEFDPQAGELKVSFSGRTLVFLFSTVQGDSGALNGKINVYLMRRIPTQAFESIGELSFDGNGQSNMIDPSDNDQLHVQGSATYIALHFLNESLGA